MKKIVLTTIALLALIFASTALAHGNRTTLTLNVAPNPVTTGSDINGSGRLTDGHRGVRHQTITLVAFTGSGCDSEEALGSENTQTDWNGNYTDTFTVPADATPGAYSVRAFTWFKHRLAASDCVDVTVNAPAPPPVLTAPNSRSIYLCWNSATIPGNWDSTDALALVAAGYYQPEALAGNVDGGINVGAFHLVCNTGKTGDGSTVGDGGTVFGPDYGPALTELGFYKIVA